MIRLLKRELDFAREQVSSMFEFAGARPPEVPSESEVAIIAPSTVSAVEPYRGPLSRRLVPWSQSLAADGHVDRAMQRRHLELTRIPGRAQPAGYDEGFTTEPEPPERDQ